MSDPTKPPGPWHFIRALVKRMPMPMTALFLVAACFVAARWMHNTGRVANEQELLNSLLTGTGLLIVAYQLRQQRRSDLVANEYLHQPVFSITGFGRDIHGASPTTCPPENRCDDIHWFDLNQVGDHPAREIRMCLLHKTEDNEVRRDSRWVSFPIAVKGERMQYRILPGEVPNALIETEGKGELFFLLDYRSSYSGIRYKRIHMIGYMPIKTRGDKQVWVDGVKFISCSVVRAFDSESISTFLLLKSRVLHELRRFGWRKHYTDEEWVRMF